jgi:hypothetical protein
MYFAANSLLLYFSIFRQYFYQLLNTNYHRVLYSLTYEYFVYESPIPNYKHYY